MRLSGRTGSKTLNIRNRDCSPNLGGRGGDGSYSSVSVVHRGSVGSMIYPEHSRIASHTIGSPRCKSSKFDTSCG